VDTVSVLQRPAPSEIKNFHASVEVETSKKLKILQPIGGRGWGGAYILGVWSILHQVGRRTPSHYPLFPLTEWGGGTTQPNRVSHGALLAQDKGVARLLLG
jgi:hypothetical protein